MMTSSTDRYGDDAIARLTGLTLDPETPPHIQHSFISKEEPLHPSSDAGSHPSQLSIRSLVTTKEAGVVIGKAGKNVAQLREVTGVKAGVSKVIQGVYERVLSITGPLENVAKAYSIIAKNLIDNPTNTFQPASTDSTTIRLLVPHQLMGSVIGKGGLKIREIQEKSGCKIVISKEMLPQSTERVIEIYGLVESIQIAVQLIGECILNDIDRAAGSIPYNPQVRLGGGIGAISSKRDDTFSHTNSRFKPAGDGTRSPLLSPAAGEETRHVAIPSGMVGCIIGRGGNFINEIRRLSGCRISISKLKEPGTNNRTFTVVGTPDAIEKALNMLYNQLDAEKERRLKENVD